jgi:hypothetical protein
MSAAPASTTAAYPQHLSIRVCKWPIRVWKLSTEGSQASPELSEILSQEAPELSDVIGVDRLAVFFPLIPRDERDFKAPAKDSFKLGGAGVDLRTFSWMGKKYARLDFNPSRVIDAQGTAICPIDRLLGVIADVYDGLPGWVEPAETIDQWIVTTLHLARDFIEVDVPGYVTALHEIRRPYDKKKSLYGPRGRETGLVMGSNSGTVIGYDKSVESKGKVPPGIMRWEVQARKPWLKKHAIVCVGDLTKLKVGALAQDRWNWCKGGLPLLYPNAVHDYIYSRDWTDEERERVFGRYLHKQVKRRAKVTNDSFTPLLEQLEQAVAAGELSVTLDILQGRPIPHPVRTAA